MNPADSVLFKLSNPCELREFKLQFMSRTALTIDDGSMRLQLINPHPLEAAFGLVTSDPSDVLVLDARLAQRERHKVRVTWLNGEGQQQEFWAESAEQIGAQLGAQADTPRAPLS